MTADQKPGLKIELPSFAFAGEFTSPAKPLDESKGKGFIVKNLGGKQADVYLKSYGDENYIPRQGLITVVCQDKTRNGFAFIEDASTISFWLTDVKLRLAFPRSAFLPTPEKKKIVTFALARNNQHARPIYRSDIDFNRSQIHLLGMLLSPEEETLQRRRYELLGKTDPEKLSKTKINEEMSHLDRWFIYLSHLTQAIREGTPKPIQPLNRVVLIDAAFGLP